MSCLSPRFLIVVLAAALPCMPPVLARLRSSTVDFPSRRLCKKPRSKGRDVWVIGTGRGRDDEITIATRQHDVEQLDQTPSGQIIAGEGNLSQRDTDTV